MPREADDLRGGSLLARSLERWIRAVVRWRVPVVIAAAAVTALSLVYAVRNLGIETSREDMISPDLEFRRLQIELEEEFPRVFGELVVVVDAPTPERSREVALDLAERLAEREELFSSVFLPRANEFLERTALLHLDLEELRALADQLVRAQPFLGRLSRDPTLRGLLDLLETAVMARDGGREVELAPILREIDATTRALLEGRTRTVSWQTLVSGGSRALEARRQFVLLEPRLAEGALYPAGPALAAVREAAEAAGATSEPEAAGAEEEARVRVTGGLALEHEELQTVRTGAEWIGLGALAAVTVLLVLGMRSKRLVLHALLTLLAGLSWTAAFATAAIGHLNLISVTFAALYIGLAIDYAIHLCLRYRELSHSQRRGVAALRAAVGDVGGSLILCCLTTALGFYAFLPTDYRGVSELGLISGTGMVISLVAALTLLPALISLSPPPPEVVAIRRRPRESAVDFPVRHRLGVRWTAGVLGVAALGSLPFVRFDTNPLNLRDPRSESVRTFRELLETSPTPPWSMHAMTPDAASAVALAQELTALEEIGGAVTLASFVPERQERKLEILADLALVLGAELELDPDPEKASLAERTEALRRLVDALGAKPGSPEERSAHRSLAGLLAAVQTASPERASELFDRLEASLLDTLPASLQRLRSALDATRVSLDDVPPEWRSRWVAEDGTCRVEAFPAVDIETPEAMRRFVDAVLAVEPRASGSPRAILESGDVVVLAFRTALLAAVGATLTLLLVLLRSIRDAVLVVAPLLLAAVLLCASMVLFGISFNFANVIGLPLLLGLGVDSSIHMVHRARTTGAVGLLHTSTARAILLSTATTLASFFNLSFTPHPGTASLGRILSIGILWTIVCTLIVLPALLARRHRRAGPRQAPRRERPSAQATS